MPSNLFWSWPSFASQPQTGWRQGWRDAWRGAWKETWREAWSQAWSSREIDIDGRGTASVRSLPDPDSALDLNDLSQRSVIALAFAAAHLVARLADAHGLAVRVIVDPAHRAVPPAALLAMAPRGSADVSAMLREILGRPSQVSPLMRLAADAISARAVLVRLRRALWPSFSWE
jgi:hypothetical protein